jgi:hypothetical protein
MPGHDTATAIGGQARTAFATLPQGTPPELFAAIEAAARNVLARPGGGLPAFTMTRQAALAHEAGHAIVGAHEGLGVRAVSIFSREVPPLGPAWGGRCAWAGGGWTTGPETSAEDDLRIGRMIVAGLAGEAVIQQDKPGSSLDELALSQLLGVHAAVKLDPRGEDGGILDQEAVSALWHERVWNVAVRILCGNWEPFTKIMEHLHEHEKIAGGKLRRTLAQVQRIAA